MNCHCGLRIADCGLRLCCLVVALLLATVVAGADEGTEAQAKKTVIELAAASEVAGKVITLKDIARITSDDADLAQRLAAIEIQSAAPPAQTVQIDTGFIRLRLRQAKIVLEPIEFIAPKQIAVTTRHRTVTQQEMANAAKQWLLTQPAYQGRDVEVEMPMMLRDLIVPEGEVELRVTSPMSGTSESPLVSVNVLVDGKVTRTLNLSPKVRVFGEVLVLTRSLERHEALDESAVKRERRELNRLSSDACRDFSELNGQRATRSLPAGGVLTKQALEPIPAVRKGDKITVVATIGTLKVTLTAEAKEDGWIGKTVLVRNTDSNKTFTATVVDNGVAEVKF